MSLAVLIGDPVSPSFLPFKKEGSEGPHGGSRSGEIFFLWESHCVCGLGARTGQTAHPSLWNSGIIQNCHELFKLFVTELKFLDRN